MTSQKTLDRLLRLKRFEDGVLDGGGELRYLARHSGLATAAEARGALRSRGFVLRETPTGLSIWVRDSKHLRGKKWHNRNTKPTVRSNR